jgi:hypothetical protein
MQARNYTVEQSLSRMFFVTVKVYCVSKILLTSACLLAGLKLAIAVGHRSSDLLEYSLELTPSKGRLQLWSS